jgi:hypothetical protein
MDHLFGCFVQLFAAKILKIIILQFEHLRETKDLAAELAT